MKILQQKSILVILLFLVGIIKSQAQAPDSSARDQEIFTFAEQMPEYPGGQEKMYGFLSKTIKYPKSLREKKVEGKVYCTFVVNPDGSLSDFEVVNKTEALFAEEALRVMKLMPNWRPGKQNGKTVAVKFTLPVSFKLQ